MGSCEDGELTGEDGNTYFVGAGYEDYAAMHAYCWHAAGRPKSYEQIHHYRATYEVTFASQYQEQLFDFAACVADGKAWMLVDPSSEAGSRNKERIHAILEANPPADSDPVTVEQLLSTDSWIYSVRRYEGGSGFWRYRTNVTAALDKSGYFRLFWVGLEPQGTPLAEMERFEKEFYGRVQGAAHAVALATLTVVGKYWFVLYAKNPDACRALLGELCPVKDYEINEQEDPDWEAYFEEIHSNF